MERQLEWGLREEVPEAATTAWGARWIFPDDVLWDRQDFVNMQTPDGERLKNWLNGASRDNMSGALAKSRAAARKLPKSFQQESTVIVLHEDGAGVVKANPKGSYGYLYVCAYLK